MNESKNEKLWHWIDSRCDECAHNILPTGESHFEMSLDSWSVRMQWHYRIVCNRLAPLDVAPNRNRWELNEKKTE